MYIIYTIHYVYIIYIILIKATYKGFLLSKYLLFCLLHLFIILTETSLFLWPWATEEEIYRDDLAELEQKRLICRLFPFNHGNLRRCSFVSLVVNRVEDDAWYMLEGKTQNFNFSFWWEAKVKNFKTIFFVFLFYQAYHMRPDLCFNFVWLPRGTAHNSAHCKACFLLTWELCPPGTCGW